MHKELLFKIVAIFNSGDVSWADEIFTLGYLDHQKPEWMEEDGPEEFKKIVVGARASLPNLVVCIMDEVIADGDKIACRLFWTSDTLERETLEILRVENGKVAEHWGAEAWSRSVSF